MRGIARAPGTCGELVQGTAGDVNFHVTCPVDLYAVVEVVIKPGQNTLNPDDSNRKAQEAAARTLAFFDLNNFSADVRVNSSLPAGKGMASSTADITAACVATAQAVGKHITPGDIARIALTIEPSDGVMYPGLVLFDHVAGRVFRVLPELPAMKIMIIDTGGTVDTELFNARINLPDLNRQKENTIRQALTILEEGLTAGERKKIGQAATMSALANQHIIFKPELPDIINIAGACGAFGVNTAHSGTVMGILYDEKLTDTKKMRDLLRMLNRDFTIKENNLISGGAEIPAAESREALWKPYSTYMAETSGLRQQSTG